MAVASGEIQRRPGHATEGTSPCSEAASAPRCERAGERAFYLRTEGMRPGQSQSQEGKVVPRGKDDLRRARR
jgi:hypothetical protein